MSLPTTPGLLHPAPMTPTALRRALRAHRPTRSLAEQTDAHALLRDAERLADTAPYDVELRRLTAGCFDLAHGADGLPPVIAEVRRGELVRWDRFSLTFEGVHVRTGAPVLVRTLRAGCRLPVWRRMLVRERDLLKELYPSGVQLIHDEGTTLLLDLPGDPLFQGVPMAPARALRAVVRVVADLHARERAGLGTLGPDLCELRETERGAAVASLTALSAHPADLGALATDLRSLTVEPSLIDRSLAACAAFPHASANDWAAEISALLAEDLADRRHRARTTWVTRRSRFKRSRLLAAVARLERFPPPVGSAVIARDIDGRSTVLSSDGHTVRWGPTEGPHLMVLSERGLHPQVARRMLRARSTSRLDSVGDDFVERACRWVAAALALRTISLLLKRPA